MNAGGGSGASARETVEEFRPLGVAAFTTTRVAGDFALVPGGESTDATGRWQALQATLPAGAGLVSALQVHGTAVAIHTAPWAGLRRLDGFDAHVVRAAGGAAITIADCVPVFLAHPDGTVGVVHAGWRGVAGRILVAALDAMTGDGRRASDVRVHLGPAICGRCYEVGPDVYERLTGWQTIRHRHVDLRALLAEQAKEAGANAVTATLSCTRCDNDVFFSHRAGDAGRQVAVIVAP